MPIQSGIYVITNAHQLNPVFLENPNDDEPIQGHYKPDDTSERTQAQWHWRVTDLKNECHLIQNVEHKRYANCGSRAGLNAHVKGASEKQEWRIQETRCKGEYTIGTIDGPNFWMLPARGKSTPVELFDRPNDRKCWWTFTNVETEAPVNGDTTNPAFLFELKPLPILSFSPLRLDLLVIQQKSDDSIENASRTIAAVCGPLASLRRPRSDALCVNIIEVTSDGFDIFFHRSYDVVTFEKLLNLGGENISWEGCDGDPSLPDIAMRGLRPNTTKVAILNLNFNLLWQGGQAITNLIAGLAKHDITLILAPIQSTWERAFPDSAVSRELKKFSFKYRRFEQEGEFSDYVVNYNKRVALPRLSEYPNLCDTIRPNIPHIIEVLKEENQNTRSAAVAAFSQLAEYAELRDTISQVVPKIVGMLKGNKDEAEVAASALIELAKQSQIRHIICQAIPHIVEMLKDKNYDRQSTVVGVLRKFTEHTELHDAIFSAVLKIIEMFTVDNSGAEEAASALVELAEYVELCGVGANFRDCSGRGSLAWAAGRGYYAFVRIILAQKGVKVDGTNDIGQTPLLLAAIKGHDAVVRLLLEQEGVDADSKDEYGRTPLSWAAEKGHDAVVRLLLEQEGVDANSKDKSGQTPLSWAAKNGHDAVVQLLLEQEGVDANSKDKDGQTPRSLAAANGHRAVARLLLAPQTPKWGLTAFLKHLK